MGLVEEEDPCHSMRQCCTVWKLPSSSPLPGTGQPAALSPGPDPEEWNLVCLHLQAMRELVTQLLFSVGRDREEVHICARALWEHKEAVGGQERGVEVQKHF